MEFGVRLTADGKVATAEIGRAEEALRKVSATAEQASQRVETSAKQAAFAMRQLPMQMTDIAVGLASGQSPFMVLMQQGGQLKDTFGGIGPAIRAVGGYVAGLVNPFTIAAAAVGGLGAAYLMGQREAESYARAIILTGNAAGTTVSQLQSAAAETARMAGDTVGSAAGAIAALVGTGKVAADNLGMVAEAAMRMERAGVQSIDETVKQFAALGTKPVDASLKLNEQTNYLTADLYKQIKALEDQGRASDAAALAQKTYAEEMSRRTKEIEESLGTLERKWLAVKRAAGLALDVALGIGAKTNIDTQVQAAEAALRNAEAGFRGKNDTEALRANLAALRDQRDGELATAAAKAASTEATKQQIEHERAWGDLQQRLSGVSKNFGQDLRTLYDEYAAGGMGIEEYRAKVAKLIQTETEIGRVRSSAKDNGVDDFAREQAKEYAQLYEAGLKYAEGVERQLAAGRKLTEGEKILAMAKAKLTDTQYKEVEAMLSGAVAREAAVAALQASTKAADEAAKAENDYMRPLEERLDKLNEEIEFYGMSASAIEAVLLKRLEDGRAQEVANGASAETIARLDREIAARRDLAGALGSKEALDANKRAADESAKAWEKITDDINKSLTDAIFEGGVDAGELLKRYFKTLVLAPAVQMLTAPVTSAVGSLLGYNTGGTSGSNLLSLGSNAYSTATGYSALLAGTEAYGTGFAAAAGGADLAGAIAAYEAAGYGAVATGLSAGATSAGALGASASTGTAVGSAMSGLAAAAPYVAAAVAVLSMIDWGGGTPHAGGIAYSSGDGYTTPNTQAGISAYYADQSAADQMILKDWTRRFNQTTANALGPAAEGFAQTFNEIVTANGLAGGYQFGLAFSADGEDPVRARSSILDAAGNQVGFAKDNNQLGSDPEQGLQLMLTGQVPRLMLTTLEGMDLNALADSFLDTLDIEHLSAEAAQQALKFLASTDEIITALGHLGIGANEVTTDLIRALGGIEAAGTALDAYYQGFYTDAERSANVTADVQAKFTALGLTMPLTTAGFVDLMDGLDLTTEAGRATYAQLLQLSPQFLAVADAAQQAAQQWAGFDAAGLGQMLLDAAFDPAAGMSAAESFSAALDSSVRNALISSTVGSVATMIYNSIVVPMVAGAAVSQAAIDTVVQQAQAALTSLGTVLKNLDLSAITSAVAALLPSIANFAPQAVAAQSSVAQQALDATDTISAAWQDMADSIVETARRLRGDLLTEAQSFAQLQADFAITTAAARAGDSVAAGRLSDLASSLVDAARLVSATGEDYTLIAARTIASLNTTVEALHDKYGVTIPTFAAGGDHAGGYAIVGESGPELAYMPPARVYSSSDSRALLDLEPLVTEIRRLDARLATIERHAEATARATNGEGRAPILVETV